MAVQIRQVPRGLAISRGKKRRVRTSLFSWCLILLMARRCWAARWQSSWPPSWPACVDPARRRL